MTMLAVVEPLMPRTAMKPTNAANTSAIATCPNGGMVMPNWLAM